MSGFQEILAVAVILLLIVFLPRMRGHRREAADIRQPTLRMTGRLRVAIAASIFYPVLAAAIIRPWEGDLVRFLYVGIGPVVFAWLLYWVLMGFRKKSNS